MEDAQMQDLGIDTSAEWVDAVVNLSTGVALVRHTPDEGPDLVSVSSGDFITNIDWESTRKAIEEIVG